MVCNSLLYLHELHVKYVNACKDLIRKLCNYIDAIHILSHGYLSINLVPPSQLYGMIKQGKKVILKTKPNYD